MKRRSFYLAFLTVLFTVCAFVVPVSAASKVKLSSKSLNVKVGEQVLLTLNNASDDVEWTTTKKTVELKTAGNSVIITGVNAGTTNVKAVYNGKTYKCKVTVESNEDEGTGIAYTIKIYDISSQKYINREGRFDGETKDGVPNGKGKFYTKNSTHDYVISGTFKDGKMNGLMKITFSSGLYEEYECKNGKFIKTIFYNTDGSKEEYILVNDILYCIYDDESFSHYSSDAKKEKSTVIDWLFKVDYSYYSGYDMSSDSAINMDTIRRLSNSEIKKKSKHIELKKLKKSLKPYLDSVDYLKEAYVISCEEIEPHESWGIDTITKMLLYYDDYVYIVWYEGSIDVYEGDYVSCWFTPFANVSYQNISNTTSKGTCGVAYIVKKVS